MEQRQQPGTPTANWATLPLLSRLSCVDLLSLQAKTLAAKLNLGQDAPTLSKTSFQRCRRGSRNQHLQSCGKTRVQPFNSRQSPPGPWLQKCCLSGFLVHPKKTLPLQSTVVRLLRVFLPKKIFTKFEDVEWAVSDFFGSQSPQF